MQMSVFFFHKTLGDAQDLIGRGGKKNIAEAFRIIDAHTFVVVKDAKVEQISFVHLIKSADAYLKALEMAKKSVERNDSQGAIGNLTSAIEYGEEVVEFAKRV